MTQHKKTFFLDLQDELESIFLALNHTHSEEQVRAIHEAKVLLSKLEELNKHLSHFFQEYPFLQNTFQKTYFHPDLIKSRENIIEIIFLEDFLVPEKGLFPFIDENNLFQEPDFSEIMPLPQQILSPHMDNQEELQTKKTLDELVLSKRHCPCSHCLATYRTKFRQLLFEKIKQMVSDCHDTLTAPCPERTIEDFSQHIYDLQRNIEKLFRKHRQQLKRATLSKLEIQSKKLLKETFSFPQQIAQEQAKIVKNILINHLESEGHSGELFTQEEYEKFFKQLGMNLWRNENIILREFRKLVQSFLRFKREDISSNILQEYLGQFWIHSRARRIKRKIIYHMGPTNSGKTYHAIEALAKASSGMYLAPLRLLASELYDTLTEKGVSTTLLTGEEVIEVPESTHFSSTIEMAKLHEPFDCCVIDEIQMISDTQRGWAWTRALVNVMAPEIHICGDGSVLNLIKHLVDLTDDTLEIQEYQRLTKLSVASHPITLDELEKGDALIVFSRRNALKFKKDLESIGPRVSIIYGRLGPEVRREQARKFDEGETDILVSTDAIAMGMNLPIKRIIFSTLSKYIDSEEIHISESEIKQLAGRAGRYKRFPVGTVTTLRGVDDGISRIKESIECKLPQKTQAMVGPDLEIFSQVNQALTEKSLPPLPLSEFLRLFNTMSFEKPFYCVELNEMIELAEIIEDANRKSMILSDSETFGFACAPVHMGITEHLQYFIYILNNYIKGKETSCERINSHSDNIDYLETSIKCVELYQWLSRHFHKKFFEDDESELLQNKAKAINKLNKLLSNKLVSYCTSCRVKLSPESKFNICENCFLNLRKSYKRRRPSSSSDLPPRGSKRSGKTPSKGARGKQGPRKSKKSFKPRK